MTRAALVVMCGDPFVNADWFRNYRTWVDRVDELRIVVTDQPGPAFERYMADLTVDLNVAAIDYWPRTDHGVVLNYLVNHTSADVVMLTEDDAFIRKPDYVAESFARIERGEVDVVGCPRATGSPGIIDYATERYGTWIAEATGEQGPLLWPTFLFARRSDLLRTDGNFSVWGAKANEVKLGRAWSQDQAMDTFGWATLQLRDLGLRFRIEPNYRAQCDLLPTWTDAPWFHVGGLSVGHGSYFLGPEEERGPRHLREQHKEDWEKRAAWWQRVAEKGSELPEYREVYRQAVETFIDRSAMDRGNIARWRAGFDTLVNW